MILCSIVPQMDYARPQGDFEKNLVKMNHILSGSTNYVFRGLHYIGVIQEYGILQNSVLWSTGESHLAHKSWGLVFHSVYV